MKEFKRILFPVDLSESSEKIIPYIQTVAEKLGFKIQKVLGAGEYELSIDKSIFFILSGRGEVLNCLARPTLRYCQIMYRPQHLILSRSPLFDFYFSHKFGTLA